MTTYEGAVEQIWRHFDSVPTATNSIKEGVSPESSPLLRELIRYACLAPNSHNTQPWLFSIDTIKNSKKSEGATIVTVLPDFARACPTVDPDNHHLYVSLGCAVENLVIAARAHGFKATVDPTTPHHGIPITLTPCAQLDSKSDLFDAIPTRQCTRNEYDGEPLSIQEMKLLQQATAEFPGVHTVFLTSLEEQQLISEFVLRANAAQFANQDFKNELRDWLRFSETEAVHKGDGMVGRCFGNNAPSTPRWVGKLVFSLVVGPESEKLARQLESSSGMVAFVSEHDDPTHWVQVGRCYERFALQATALNIKNAMVNQPVEETNVRPAFQKALGLDSYGTRTDLLVRFGKSTDMPRSLRRKVDHVIVDAKE